MHQFRKQFIMFGTEDYDDLKSNINETSIEEIASSLGSMLSGYSALHFNLKGLHETVSGGPGTFWSMLQNLPGIISEKCRYLFFGAGSQVKSPVDLLYPGLSGENRICAEGFAWGAGLPAKLYDRSCE